VVRDFGGRVKPLSQRIQARSASDVEETFPSIRRGEEIIYLTRADVERCGGGEAAIMARVRAALTAHGLKKCEMPAKIGLHPLGACVGSRG